MANEPQLDLLLLVGGIIYGLVIPMTISLIIVTNGLQNHSGYDNTPLILAFIFMFANRCVYGLAGINGALLTATLEVCLTVYLHTWDAHRDEKRALLQTKHEFASKVGLGVTDGRVDGAFEVLSEKGRTSINTSRDLDEMLSKYDVEHKRKQQKREEKRLFR